VRRHVLAGRSGPAPLAYLERVIARRVYTGGERRWRLALTLVLAAYGWLLLRTPGDYRWLDSLDLAIHESGHLVFAFGGEFLTILGGTLLQLLIPAAFVVALWRQGDSHGATVPLWWLGQNCLNVAVYVNDARAQELPLVGGGEHDWALLLERFGLLHRDIIIGRAVGAAGMVLMILAVALGWKVLFGAPAGSGSGQ
jgi:hypothetical protein